MSKFVKFSLLAAIGGVLLTIPVLVQETPLTFVLFSFLAQPLLILSFGAFLVSVGSDLKKAGLF
ncbi:MAG: hypothetical protein ABIQ65_08960 [Thermoanaerobaculia bacterium]